MSRKTAVYRQLNEINRNQAFQPKSPSCQSFFNAKARRVQRKAEKNQITRWLSQEFSPSLCVLAFFLCASALKCFFQGDLLFLRAPRLALRLGVEKARPTAASRINPSVGATWRRQPALARHRRARHLGFKKLLTRLLCGLLLALPAAADDGLGRLFTTPEQRAALDRQRNPGAAAPSGRGSVRRSLGPPTAWPDGTPQTAPRAPLERRPP